MEEGEGKFMSNPMNIFVARDGEKNEKNDSGLTIWLTERPTLTPDGEYPFWQGENERGKALDSALHPEILNGTCRMFELVDKGEVKDGLK